MQILLTIWAIPEQEKQASWSSGMIDASGCETWVL